MRPSLRVVSFASFVALAAGCRFSLERALEPGDLRGRLVAVEADGSRTPAAGARVSLESGPVTVKADDQGRFVLRGLPPGEFALRATWTPEGGQPSALRLGRVVLEAIPGGLASARDLGTVDIGGLGALSGRVIDHGELVPDVTVVLDGFGARPALDGTFSFGSLSAGEYGVAVISPTGVRRAAQVTIVAREPETLELDLGTLVPVGAGSVSGRVRVAGGASLAGATVALVGATPGPQPLGEDGFWVVPAVPPGVYTLLVASPGARSTQVPFLVVAGDTTAPDVLLVGDQQGCALGGVGVGAPGDGDEDGDGTPDLDEADACLCRAGTHDLDDDGLCDDADLLVDLDGDGFDDATDNCAGRSNDQADSDHDGFGDACDVCPDLLDNQADSDDDGVGDACDTCPALDGAPQTDTDGDGFGDACDVCPDERDDQTDGDRDGVGDACDSCPALSGAAQLDTDEDGFGDACDVCPSVNDDQTDTDGDAVGDACDTCPIVGAPQLDADGDGFGDACDVCVDLPGDQTDRDGDGLGDACDVCPGLAFSSQNDRDGDGLGDTCDNCPAVFDPTQADADLDGIGDACDGPPPWTITLTTDPLTSWTEGGQGFVATGRPVTLGVDIPAGTDAVVTFESVGPLPVVVTPVPDVLNRFTFTADAVGTIQLEATVVVGGTTEVKALVLQAILDHAKAMFFDQAAGVDTNSGLFGAPKQDPVAYLNALGPTDARRHLYLRAGNYPNAGVGINVSEATDRGPDRVFVFGGYGPDPGWSRDPIANRTDLQNQSSAPFEVGRTPAPGDLVLDGLTFAYGYGVSCNGGAIRVFNSYVNANNGAAVGTINCAGLVANDILIAGNSYPAVTSYGDTGRRSELRIIHNLLINNSAYGVVFDHGSLLGGEARFNLILQNNNANALSKVLVGGGNTVVHPANVPTVALEKANAELDRILLATERNVFDRACTPGNPQASYDDVGGIVTTGRFPLARHASCYATTPIPTADDPLDVATLRRDRRGRLRQDAQRMRGPDELDDTDLDGVDDFLDGCPLDATRSPPIGSCPVYPMLVNVSLSKEFSVVGESVTVFAFNNNAVPVTWTAELAGWSEASELTPRAGQHGTWDLVGRAIGNAAVRVTMLETATGREFERIVSLEVRPQRARTIFVDLYAATDGDGTEYSPRNVWPTDLATIATAATPVDLLVSEVTGYDGQKLPYDTWLPEHVRVLGGYAKRADGRWVRRLPLAETNLQAAPGPFSSRVGLVVAPGSPTAAPSTRVLDGITFGTSGILNEATLHVSGPLLMTRCRVDQQYSPAPTTLEVLAGGNVALVGNAISYVGGSSTSISLVDLQANTKPTFLLNDLYRSMPVSSVAPNVAGAAFRLLGADVGGSFAGNRYWIGSTGGSKFAFFDVAQSGSVLTPQMVFGNALIPGASVFALWNGTGSDWSPNVTSLATAQPANATANLRTVDAATPNAYGWGPGPGPSLRGAAGDTAARAVALEAGLTGSAANNLDLDVNGRRRSQTAADIGAQVMPPLP